MLALIFPSIFLKKSSALGYAMILMALGPSCVAADTTSDRPATYDQYLRMSELVKNQTSEVYWLADKNSFWIQANGQISLLETTNPEPMINIDEDRFRESLVSTFGEDAQSKPLPMSTFKPSGKSKVDFVWQGIPATFATHDYSITTQPDQTLAPGFFKRNLVLYTTERAPDILAPNSKYLATVRNGNLALRSTEDGNYTNLTTDSEERFGWDLDGTRFSIGNMKEAPVTPWSPDSQHLFAIKLDRRAVPQIPDYRPIHDPLPDVIMTDYLAAGGPHYRYDPFIVDVKSKKILPITGVDVSEHFVLLLEWAEDNRTVYFARLNRNFSQIDVIAADAATGTAIIIFTEKGEPGLRSPHEVYYAGNMGFTLLPEKAGFLWRSAKDGWRQLYHHDLSGKLVRKVTQDTYPVDMVKSIDWRNRQVYFTARSDMQNVYDFHLMRVSLDGGKPVQLTKGRGEHTATLSSDNMYFIDQYSSVSIPPQTELRTTAGKLVRVLHKADISELKATGWTPPLEFVVKAADGKTDVHGVMYRPADFDPTKRYPVIEHIYGGAPMINRDTTFIASEVPSGNYEQALAQLGYLVVKFDTPGTAGRSRAFQMEVMNKWGPGLVKDHAAVIANLGKAYGFVDAGRVGIYGHSWGGQNALMALANEDIYDAAIATAPGSSQGKLQDFFMEAYFGSPEENPEPYKRAEIFNYLGQISKPLLIGAGTQDYFLYSMTLRISNALIRDGIQHEFVALPTQGHGIYGPYADYLTEKMTQFFLINVPPDSVTP